METTFEDISDDCLLEIMSYLSAEDILNVSDVCLRLRNLAKSKWLWSRCELRDLQMRKCSLCRCFRLAPALKSFSLTHSSIFEAQDFQDSVFAGCCSVKELYIICESHLDLETMHRFLSHFAMELETLKLVIFGDLMRTISRMPSLKTFSILGSAPPHPSQDYCTAEPGEVWPCLEELDLGMCRESRVNNIVLPFVLQNAKQLKSVTFPHRTSILDNRIFYELLPKCYQLESLSIDLGDFKHIKNVRRQLKCLKLRCFYWVNSMKVEQCEDLRFVEKLALGLSSSWERAVSILEQCENLQSLVLYGDSLCSSLSQILRLAPKSVTRLKVSCYMLRVRHVFSAIKLLPRLKVLDMRGCFLERGLDPRIFRKVHSISPHTKLITDPFKLYESFREARYDVECDEDFCTDMEMEDTENMR